ncbi:DUF488 family protein [Dactylosporangium fulvum]
MTLLCATRVHEYDTSVGDPVAQADDGEMTKDITYRRIYEESSPEDGRRVLVDRIWPRGMRKADAHLDEWLRDVAPSTELRRWYSHEPGRFAEFRRRYLTELREPARRQAVDHLRDIADRDKLTLLTATHDVEHSQAAVLAEWLTSAGRSRA